MLKRKWKMFSSLIPMMLLTACAETTSDTIIVVPPVIQYSAEVQNKALDEMEALGWIRGHDRPEVPPCLANEVTPGCSALKTFVRDYKWTRDKLRELRAVK